MSTRAGGCSGFGWSEAGAAKPPPGAMVSFKFLAQSTDCFRIEMFFGDVAESPASA
ncbi:MAG: hypothetical protein QM757_03760 [Paludibaculum sp.]